MEYQKIIEQLEKKDSTILSFPDRGPVGRSILSGKLLWLGAGVPHMEISGSEVCRIVFGFWNRL